jgi:hypothetical protein
MRFLSENYFKNEDEKLMQYTYEATFHSKERKNQSTVG